MPATILRAIAILAILPLPSFAREFNPRDYGAKADGKSDDTAALRSCFEAAAAAGGGAVRIPPGDYLLEGRAAIPLCSRITVTAHGARFHLPARLGDRARVVLFAGTDVTDLNWNGGRFLGHVFDPERTANDWEPNANTRGILVSTTPGGRTERLTFRDVTSDGMAGAVITVLGAEKKGSDREVESYARQITVERCTLERSGKFMWDYGYLWQITVWPEEYGEAERAMAAKYFRNDLVRGPLRIAAGEDRVRFDNRKPLPLTQSGENGRNTVCFFGDRLPANLVRGRQYFVVESAPDYIRVAERPGGAAVRFSQDAGPNAKLIADLFQAHPALYAPTGSGPGKGALDLVGCQQVVVRACRLSALGDTMHIQKSREILFADNVISGSRMGAFFLAEFCRDATIVGNRVDGTNGSRVMSIEKSAENVTVKGNTFIHGGRGSWINQPRNLVLEDNVFRNNTTKCQRDPRHGRRSFLTGDYERYAEMYFTTYEPQGRYGNVVIRGNSFTTGPEASHAITFAPGGDSLRVENNTFAGPVRSIPPAEECTGVVIRDNRGLDQK